MDPEDFSTSIFMARLEQTASRLAPAKAAAEQALVVASRAGAERDRSVALTTLGDVLALEGDRQGELRAYRKSLGIRDTLAAKDPGNTQWQRDLIVSDAKPAEVAEAAAETATARAHYATALRIAERLAANGLLPPLWLVGGRAEGEAGAGRRLRAPAG